ncbi:MAG: alpha/beta fold hydrolase [Planctomycetota bacterium]|nr:MAG: alpha/beta fold hydrolase [Planctomycetota bacterium]
MDEVLPAPLASCRSCILLRGLMHEAGHWHGFARHLSQAMPSHQCTMIDHPGVGTLLGVSAPWSIAAMADAARARSGPGPHVLLATSLGSMVAAAWAHRYPESVAGMILLVPSMRQAPLWARLRPRAMGLMLLALARQRAPQVAYAVQRMTSNRGDDPEHRRIAAERICIARRRPPQASVLLRQLWAAARFSLPPAPSCPVVVVTSAGDGMVHPACGRMWAKRWRCRHLQHPSAGHDLRIDDAPWLLRQVQNFLRNALP